MVGNLCQRGCLLSRVVLCGHEGHLADGGRYRLLPDLHLDGGAVLGERRVHVTHGNVHFQAGGGAAAGHLACRKQQRHIQGCRQRFELFRSHLILLPFINFAHNDAQKFKFNLTCVKFQKAMP